MKASAVAAAPPISMKARSGCSGSAAILPILEIGALEGPDVVAF
ncbi:MAG TPA: hypothetical protein VMU69_29015 [Bradyrhizobium sp.]|nr:hypothetical protein [Bradyrhizobium sp.]